MLPFLQEMSNFVQHCYELTKNFIRQLASLYPFRTANLFEKTNTKHKTQNKKQNKTKQTKKSIFVLDN
jgi:uncharacterized Fe-S cluster-containing protein